MIHAFYQFKKHQVLFRMMILIFCILSIDLFAEEEKFQYNGGFRTRGFMLNRDILLIQNPSPTKNTPEKENQTFADTRLNLNGRYNVSKMIDINVGFVVGDIRFGGANNNVQRQPNNPFDPTLIGFNSGGDINRSSGINFQTTFLYANIKQNDWYIRVGLQMELVFLSIKILFRSNNLSKLVTFEVQIKQSTM